MKNRSTILLAILPVLACFTVLPGARAITPPPDGCFPNFTTAEGCDALSSLTIGAGNTGLGWRALFTDSTGNFNTGVGAGALVLNNADSNTAVGAAALLLNTSGTQNTAVGTGTLVFNDSGSSNTATGYFALMNNTTGGSNTAIGWEALTANTIGDNNVALGTLTLSSNTSGTNNTAIGNLALQNSVTPATMLRRQTGRVWDHRPPIITLSSATTLVCTVALARKVQVLYRQHLWCERCRQHGISRVVLVDPDGRLGTVPVAGPDPGGFSPRGDPAPSHSRRRRASHA